MSILLRKALDVCLNKLYPDQPGDSRAVDNWFVACAAVACDLEDIDGTIELCLDKELEYDKQLQREL